MLMLKRPSQYVPDPFGAEFWTQVKENAVLKIPRPKIPEDMDPAEAKELKRRYERADQLLTMMPPASFDGAWYGVVRVHIRVGSNTARITGVIIILVCKEQLINCSFEEAVIGWEYNGVEFRAGENLKQMVDFLEKRFAVVAKEKAEAEMKNYDTAVPSTKIPFSMIAIKSGEFTMGSPESEAKRGADEGPQVKVKIKPFWMGKCEVTWDEYLPFMITDLGRNKNGSKQKPNPADGIADIISQPTTPYTEMSFGMGTDGYPAICMTQHAANKYCQWLSAQTGQFYRLPTEAEWE
jgi:hypothetical protein